MNKNSSNSTSKNFILLNKDNLSKFAKPRNKSQEPPLRKKPAIPALKNSKITDGLSIQKPVPVQIDSPEIPDKITEVLDSAKKMIETCELALSPRKSALSKMRIMPEGLDSGGSKLSGFKSTFSIQNSSKEPSWVQEGSAEIKYSIEPYQNSKEGPASQSETGQPLKKHERKTSKERNLDSRNLSETKNKPVINLKSGEILNKNNSKEPKENFTNKKSPMFGGVNEIALKGESENYSKDSQIDSKETDDEENKEFSFGEEDCEEKIKYKVCKDLKIDSSENKDEEIEEFSFGEADDYKKERDYRTGHFIDIRDGGDRELGKTYNEFLENIKKTYNVVNLRRSKRLAEKREKGLNKEENLSLKRKKSKTKAGHKPKLKY